MPSSVALFDNPPAPDELDITTLMHSALLSYVVKCLILTGYDKKKISYNSPNKITYPNLMPWGELKWNSGGVVLIPGIKSGSSLCLSSIYCSIILMEIPTFLLVSIDFKDIAMCKGNKSFDKWTCNSDSGHNRCHWSFYQASICQGDSLLGFVIPYINGTTTQ